MRRVRRIFYLGGATAVVCRSARASVRCMFVYGFRKCGIISTNILKNWSVDPASSITNALSEPNHFNWVCVSLTYLLVRSRTGCFTGICSYYSRVSRRRTTLAAVCKVLAACLESAVAEQVGEGGGGEASARIAPGKGAIFMFVIVLRTESTY